MFWDVFTTLCAQRGVSPNAVAKSLSIASGTVTNWKNGAEPQNAKLKKIADYFGVSVSYLLGVADDPDPVDPPKEKESTVTVDPELLSLIDDMTEEELDEMKRYAEFLLSKKK